jgi:hypothetical protein
MFCPTCAAEDRNHSQFCRACGTELQVVRVALQRPEAITNSAITARDEIGQAIAARIKELRTADDLKEVVEDVLPLVEKFLEFPEERRLRRYRQGVLTAATGLGAILLFLLLSSIAHNSREEVLAFLGAGGGIITFLIGLGMIINARWLTILPQGAASQGFLKQTASSENSTGPLQKEPSSAPPSNLASVTEGTTRQLE